MSEQKKPKKQRLTTDAGIAGYPWLTKPDTKFNKNGHFKINLTLEGEAAAKQKAIIDAEVEKSYAAAVDKAKSPAEAKAVYRAYPYEEVTDDDENPTGALTFKFKQNAVIKLKDGTTRNAKIDLFDAKGNKLPENVMVFGGSTVKVGYTHRPYAMVKEVIVEKDGKQQKKKTIEAGISLDLGAVQVIKLVSGNGGSAESWGFGETDGYDASEAGEAPGQSSDEAGYADAGDAPAQGDASDAGSTDF
jgi:hypothetical protein